MAKYRRMLCFLFIFLAGGVLHIALREVDFTDCFSQLYYGVVVLIWGMLVTGQIIDKRVRSITWGIVAFLELYFLLQIGRYRLTYGHSRLFWYAYYIPMMLIPLLLFFLTLYMNRQQEEKLHPTAFIAAVPAVALIALIMTNDFHQLFMRIDSGSDGITGSNMGIVVILYWVYAGLLLVAALVIMFYKCQTISKRKIIKMLVLLCLLVSLILLALSLPTAFYPAISGVKFWDTGEQFAFSFVMILEASMLLGLILVNTKYTWIFQETNLPVVIRDRSGAEVYLTKGATAVLEPSRDSVIREADISGGSVAWAIDLSVINDLNRQILNAIEQIEARNHYLTTQKALQEEKAAIDARNRVYDRIAEITGAQLEKIENLLADEDTEFLERLKKITVYNVYIKRRSNLELLRESEAEISASEIHLAIAESINYLELNHMNISLNCLAEGKLSVDAAILAYDFFETVAEHLLDQTTNMSVSISGKDNGMVVRILTDIVDCSFIERWENSEVARLHGRISTLQNDGDSILSLSFERGGAEG